MVTVGGYSSFAQGKAPEKPRQQRTVPVVTDMVAQHEVSQSISLIGKLEADRSVIIAPEITGKIKAINITADEKVEQGQVLVQLDDSKSQAALSEAKAYLADEERKLAEYQKLIKRSAITQTEIDAQQASVNIAKARLAAAKADLQDHYLTAPFLGTTGLIDFSLGKIVSAGAELISLDDLSTMQLDLNVPERYLSMLSKGMKVTASSKAWAGTNFTGELMAIDSRINPETLNLRVRVHFENDEKKLKPGMLMSATLVFPSINEPVIPVQALEYSGTKRYVYVVDENQKAQRTEVILGARIENEVLIERGVEIGDRIVVQGLVNMRDGMAVNDLTTANTEQAAEKESK
ncbi:efflux RND transporter periplasmic adaptor subunit [Vibrio sp. Of7-15]|nr:efflux RND transporter periplasmic adaptor subunit [Vibrio sp. Of7-15]